MWKDSDSDNDDNVLIPKNKLSAQKLITSLELNLLLAAAEEN